MMSDLSVLTFTSRVSAEWDAEARSELMAGIAASSRAPNRSAGITSALTWFQGRLVQVMEGPAPALEDVFTRISRDRRHREVRKLHAGPAERRLFPKMAMAVLDPRPVQDELGRIVRDLPTGDGFVLANRIMASLLAANEAAARRQARPGVVAGEAAELLVPELEAVGAHVPMALLSPSGSIMRANVAYADLFGTAPHLLQGRRRRELAMEGAVAEQRLLWRGLRTGEVQLRSYSARLEDGSRRWFESRFVPRLNTGGKLSGVVEIATDVTARHLRHADAERLLAAAEGGLWMLRLDAAGVILHANGPFLEGFGYRLEELVGRRHQVLLAGGRADPAAEAALWRGLGAGERQAGEFRRAGRDGREIWLRGSYSPVPDEDGRVTGAVLHAMDISEDRRRASENASEVAAIRRSQAVVTFSTGGIILDANELFLRAMGYELSEVVGRHHRIFVDASYSHGVEYAGLWRRLSQGEHQRGEYRRVAKDGSEVWLQATYDPVLDEGGRCIRIIKHAMVVTEEKLRQAEHQGQIAALHKAQCVISFDLAGHVVDANENFLDAMGYRLAEVRGRHHRMFMQPGEAEMPEYEAFWAALASGQHQAGEFRRRTKDGRDVWLQATYNPIFDLSGRPMRVIKYASDITAEKLRQADFQGQIEAIHKSTGVIAFSVSGEVLEANESFLSMVGYSIEELRGRHHRLLMEPADADSEEYRAFWAALREGRYASGLYRRVGRDGQTVWIQASYNPILDMDGKLLKIIKFATDVTSNVALSEAYEDAKRQAQHDPATSLPNRVRLNSFLAQALSRPEARVVVFYLDLDRFKPINDSHGHHVGDRVLGEVAERLRQHLLPGQLAARVGGDEFVVVAPEMAEEDIDAYTAALVAAIGAPMAINGLELTVGVSIGVSVGPNDGTTPDDLLRGADAALYRCKRGGGGAFSFFGSEMNDKLLCYRNMVDDLRQAIDAGQLFLEYQPRFDTASRAVRSVEALVRWTHPERGRVSPGEFIPVAEKSGLIVRLGEWVLRTACQDAVRWPAIGVSVNVSPLQFHAAGFVDMVRGVLQATGLEAERLELEITEGVVTQSAPRTQRSLCELNQMGVRLAIDDFGTGSSSLSSLWSFPFDAIKIDRQFVLDMQTRPGGRDVVQAFLSIGKGLGMSVTAEGVETDVQLEMLNDSSCAEVQGFYLARPMEAEAVSHLLARAGVLA